MKTYLFAFIYFIVGITFYGAASAQETFVADFNLSNVEWTQPRDGSMPKITRWEGTITLEEGAELYFNEKNVDPDIFTVDFIRPGDPIEITKEGYYVDNSPRFPGYDPQGTSFYRIKVPQTSVEIDVAGPSGILTPPVKAKPEQTFLSRVNVLWNQQLQDELHNEVTFFLAGNYFTLPITSEKYHGFYTNMPVQIISEELVFPEDDGLGRYQKEVSFQKLNAYGKAIGPIFKATTRLLSDQNPKVVAVDYFDLDWKSFENVSYKVLAHWKIRIELDNGLVLTIDCSDETPGYFRLANYRYTSWLYGPERAPNVRDEIHVGDEIELEESYVSNIHSNYNVRDLQTGFGYEHVLGEVHNPKP